MFNYKKSGSTTSVAQSAWKSTVGGSKKRKSATRNSPSVTLEKARQILREYYAKTGSLEGLRAKMSQSGAGKRRKSSGLKSASKMGGGGKKKSPKRKSQTKPKKKSPRKKSPKKGGKRKSPQRTK